LDRIPFADDTPAAASDAAAADAAPLREINSEDDVAGAEGKAIENIEAQPGIAPDAPGDSSTGTPSQGGADAAGGLGLTLTRAWAAVAWAAASAASAAWASAAWATTLIAAARAATT